MISLCNLAKRFYKFPNRINEIKRIYSVPPTTGGGPQSGGGGDGESRARVKGWVRSIRNQKKVSFIEVNDGSSLTGIQVVGGKDAFQSLKHGACVEVEGRLTQVPARGNSEATVEIQLEEIKVIGECPDDYPLQPKFHTLEFLRDIAHLRSRSNLFGALFRVRNQASVAIHKYFQGNGFVNMHTPIITASDCEGGGEQFQVKHTASTQGGGDHFFGQPAYLTVSGQLEAEIYALSHSRVYTFGPTFRAEKSNTTRHLAEFYMIEPEMAFIEMNDNLDIAEDFLKSILKSVYETCKTDLEYLVSKSQESSDQTSSNDHLKRIEKAINTPFIRLKYADAVKLLKEAREKNPTQFEFPIELGEDLQREHERYLTAYFEDVPVFVTHWPKAIKPFYMRANEQDPSLVDNMDLLVPDVGELIGGSIREERHALLLNRIKDLNMDEETYQWYLELRKFGSAPHGGFGLGFERFLQYITGLKNIRDVIPIPRHQNYCKF